MLDTKHLEVIKIVATVLLITKGFKAAWRIGYQNRPNLFALNIVLPSISYKIVIEVDERYNVNGYKLRVINYKQVYQDLKLVYDQGVRSCAIVFMHSFRFPHHENQISKIAKNIGFTQVAVSHQVSPLMKLVKRGDTTVVDAYLLPISCRYID